MLRLSALRTVLFLLALGVVARIPLSGQSAAHHARRITWDDVAPIQSLLESRGFSAATLDDRIARLAADNLRRVRLGDLDHLVFYLLQSSRFTARPPIEPALSAKALVDRLGPAARTGFDRDPATAASRVGDDVRGRVADLVTRSATPGEDARLAYFGQLIAEASPDPQARQQWLVSEYLRVMHFVYEKEFGAGRADAASAASLYRSRGLSTDTAIEAGFLVTQGLGVLRALDPSRRIRRVLIVGAGLDLAPRTALLEQAPPQSYQPWAVLDALVSLGLSRLDEVRIVAADINPRVVDHLRERRASPPRLTLLSGVGDGGPLTLAPGYREYVAALGRTIGRTDESPESRRRGSGIPAGHLYKELEVSPEAARTLQAERLDVVTERLDGEAFDLIVATNVLPYFDDEALTLAMSNVAAMLAGDGVLLHNESRPALHAILRELGLPSTHSRHAVIATVVGAPPLGDSVWLHERPDAPLR